MKQVLTSILTRDVLSKVLIGQEIEVEAPFTPAALEDIIFWLDPTDSDYVTYDDYLTDTVSSIEDKIGNAYGFVQGDKSLQPLKSAGGGWIGDVTGKKLAAFRLSALNGLGKFSFYTVVTPRSDLYIGAAKRALFFVSKASSSSTRRFAVYLRGGASARNVYAHVSCDTGAADGTDHNSSTTLGPQLANDVPSVVGVEVDLTGAQAKIEIYVNGSLAFTDNWTPAEGSSPWNIRNADAVQMCVGDDAGGSMSFADQDNVVLIADTLTVDERLALYTYLGAL